MIINSVELELKDLESWLSDFDVSEEFSNETCYKQTKEYVLYFDKARNKFVDASDLTLDVDRLYITATYTYIDGDDEEPGRYRLEFVFSYDAEETNLSLELEKFLETIEN